jgi:hypothetical protein
VYVDRMLMLRHVSRHTGIALRKLQDWAALASALAFAAATAALAWIVVARLFADSGALARLAAGGALFVLAYASIHLRQGSFTRRGKDTV